MRLLRVGRRIAPAPRGRASLVSEARADWTDPRAAPGLRSVQIEMSEKAWTKHKLFLLLSVGAATLCVASAAPSSMAGRPNFIFVLADGEAGP